MKIILRQEALSEKLIRYFTGKPCKHGHISERQTSNGNCLVCHAKKELKANSGNPLRAKTRNQRYYRKHKPRELVRQKEYYYDNQQACIDSVRAYQRKKPHVKRNVDAKRRAAKLHRTPSWADLTVIASIYENCPEGFTVDHVIPLQGERVSGLHVHNNLQYLTPSENSSKGNRFSCPYSS